MAMKERKIGDVVVIELRGNLMGGNEADQFQERLHSLKNEGLKKVALDMGGVHLMGSGGIGMLVAGAKTLREVGGDVKLAHLGERTHMILVVVTRLGSVFDIFETVDQAVAAFHES